MTNDTEIKEKFWKALKSDMTMFLGLAEGEDGHARPMTTQLDDQHLSGNDYDRPIWFFTSTDNGLYQQISDGSRAMAHFASKGHDVWATIHGSLSTSQDQAVIDKLWNRFV
ncbi:MAG TPA: pyridoxamine 5'-phosphate oxidase family protein, partial [Sphingorhabdus sp.]|nr:pyridoxamine 5'-phosphate oxidase family protein [Sphingorhabdus sp.]